jgi:hypothetical protein
MPSFFFASASAAAFSAAACTATLRPATPLPIPAQRRDGLAFSSRSLSSMLRSSFSRRSHSRVSSVFSPYSFRALLPPPASAGNQAHAHAHAAPRRRDDRPRNAR